MFHNCNNRNFRFMYLNFYSHLSNYSFLSSTVVSMESPPSSARVKPAIRATSVKSMSMIVKQTTALLPPCAMIEWEVTNVCVPLDIVELSVKLVSMYLFRQVIVERLDYTLPSYYEPSPSIKGFLISWY